MNLRPTTGVLAAAMLLSLTACSSGGVPADPATQAGRDRAEWVNQQFSEERWGSPNVHMASAGIGTGSDGGLEFTPKKSGWHDIGMACEGAGSITVTVAAAEGELGSGTASCGIEALTKMELPVSKITISVEGAEDSGTWALAVAPGDTPQPPKP
jgi:hypothetical protein